MQPDSAIFCYITCSSVDEAKNIASKMVEQRLAACGNILPGMISVYQWKGKIENDDEVVLILKTQKSLFEKLKSKVIELHSYETPCVISWDIDRGNKEYLDWIADETTGKL